MSWIKMRNNLWDDPRVSRLCDLTGEKEACVVGGLYWLWATADEHSEDGYMPGLTLGAIDRKTGLKGLGAGLVAIGWLVENVEGATLSRFDEHNGSSAKRRATDAQRKASGRHVSASDADNLRTDCGQTAPDDGQKTPNLGAREEKRREREEKEKNPPRKRVAGFDASRVELPDWLDSELWCRWCRDRADRKKPVTEEAAKLQIGKLDKLRAEGRTPKEVLEHAIESGHQGLYPPAVKQANGSQASAPTLQTLFRRGGA